MKSNLAVPVECLRAVCNPEEFKGIEKELKADQDGIIGQERALQALEFGLGIKSQGFNVYAAGLPGTGKETAVKEYVEKVARKAPVPPDLCYINNFKDPYRPCMLSLPPGKGIELAKDVKNLVQTVRREIPRAFESDQYAAQKEKINKYYNQQKQDLFNQLSQESVEKGFIIQSTPAGFIFVPRKESGEPMEDKEIMSLSEEERKNIYEKKNLLEEKLKAVIQEIKSLDRKAVEEIKKMDYEVALFAVDHLFADLREKYREMSRVINYLKDFQEDVMENLSLFREQEEGKKQQQPFSALPVSWPQESQFKKYEVNVIVDSSGLQGAPVVMELNPTCHNTFGRIEKESQFGALVTDFTMIRGGSLHQANGGYFVVNIEDLLKNFLTWESLKRVLRNRIIEIEEIGERLGFISYKTLRPEPVPLNVKVVLIGPPLFYYLLYKLDTDFRELFKVKAEFDVSMTRTPRNIRSYSLFIDTFCKKENLRLLDIPAMARVVEYGSRLAEDQKKLSTRFAEIADIVREACYYADSASAEYVSAEHITQAVDARIYRSNLLQEKLQEMMERDILLIDTEGEETGQVNGLSVYDTGDFSFGKPTRISCSIGLGREGIIDIERESRLGGRLHAKGVMILSGYLAARYAREVPLTLSARLVFEQSYAEIEGDSASSSELYALLSALSGLPLKQHLAVTGSVNQKGEIQAIGGVNEKIEGFFELCRSRKLTGGQGVIIPKNNEENLMLKEEVVKAVREGMFHIYAVSTIDEGIELLTGKKAGKRKEGGTYEEGSINDLVEKALFYYAEKMRHYGGEKTRKKSEAEAGCASCSKDI